MSNSILSILGRLGSTGELPRARSLRSFGQHRNIMAAMAASASGRFSSSVVKVLVNFYRSGEDSAFKRHRTRVTFDALKQSSVAAVNERSSETSTTAKLKEDVELWDKLHGRTIVSGNKLQQNLVKSVSCRFCHSNIQLLENITG